MPDASCVNVAPRDLASVIDAVDPCAFTSGRLDVNELAGGLAEIPDQD